MDRSFAVRLPKPLVVAVPPRRVITIGAAALAVLALLTGGWMLLRDSPLVSVKRVRISGVHGRDAAAIESALTAAARRMSTTDLDVGALRAAVAPYRLVRDLHVSPSYPHGLHIKVIEQPPVAALTMGSTRTAVAADGVVLGPGFLSSALPTIHGTLPATDAQNVSGARVLAELAVLGAAPETLLGWISRVYSAHNGLTVAMRNGLLIYFGDATRPNAKWLSAARVLSDSTAAGAAYVDVRLPERPAAGMGGTGEASAASTPDTQVSASDPTAAALAASLESAVKGGPATTIQTSTSTTGTVTATTAAASTAAATTGVVAAAPTSETTTETTTTP